jgi:hypothetical protein
MHTRYLDLVQLPQRRGIALRHARDQVAMMPQGRRIKGQHDARPSGRRAANFPMAANLRQLAHHRLRPQAAEKVEIGENRGSFRARGTRSCTVSGTLFHQLGGVRPPGGLRVADWQFEIAIHLLDTLPESHLIHPLAKFITNCLLDASLFVRDQILHRDLGLSLIGSYPLNARFRLYGGAGLGHSWEREHVSVQFPPSTPTIPVADTTRQF